NYDDAEIPITKLALRLAHTARAVAKLYTGHSDETIVAIAKNIERRSQQKWKRSADFPLRVQRVLEDSCEIYEPKYDEESDPNNELSGSSLSQQMLPAMILFPKDEILMATIDLEGNPYTEAGYLRAYDGWAALRLEINKPPKIVRVDHVMITHERVGTGIGKDPPVELVWSLSMPRGSGPAVTFSPYEGLNITCAIREAKRDRNGELIAVTFDTSKNEVKAELAGKITLNQKIGKEDAGYDYELLGRNPDRHRVIISDAHVTLRLEGGELIEMMTGCVGITGNGDNVTLYSPRCVDRREPPQIRLNNGSYYSGPVDMLMVDYKTKKVNIYTGKPREKSISSDEHPQKAGGYNQYTLDMK
ncbi:MAG: hypothetical protein LBF56_02895, partial [Holosporales bacterium]|nr:hypothetical protein [Holosporales bacterium]